jgi:hypothetical protein
MNTPGFKASMTVRKKPQRNANGAYLCAICSAQPRIRVIKKSGRGPVRGATIVRVIVMRQKIQLAKIVKAKEAKWEGTTISK